VLSTAEYAVALGVLAAVHLLAKRFHSGESEARSVWLSAAGGISVAYVFVHLLPGLSAGQEAVEEGIPGLDFLEDHVFIVALLGLGLFYAVELVSRRARHAERDMGSAPFWLSMTSYSIFNAAVGYLVVHWEKAMSLTTYTVAMSLHFVVNDSGLRRHHRTEYDRVGRWVLAAAIAIGWGLGEVTEISAAALALVTAFIGGGVILHVLKEELPEERPSSFWAFALGAIGYTVLLQAV
jgi:hypothetical protein